MLAWSCAETPSLGNGCSTALLKALERNTELENVRFSQTPIFPNNERTNAERLIREIYSKVKLQMSLNRGDKRILESERNVPDSLWPHSSLPSPPVIPMYCIISFVKSQMFSSTSLLLHACLVGGSVKGGSAVGSRACFKCAWMRKG